MAARLWGESGVWLIAQRRICGLIVRAVVFVFRRGFVSEAGCGLFDCAPIIATGVYVQSAVCYLVGPVEEHGEQEGGDFVGLAAPGFHAAADVEEGAADAGVLGEEGADGGELFAAEAVLEGVQVAARGAGAGTAAAAAGLIIHRWTRMIHGYGSSPQPLPVNGWGAQTGKRISGLPPGETAAFGDSVSWGWGEVGGGSGSGGPRPGLCAQNCASSRLTPALSESTIALGNSDTLMHHV